MNKKSNVSKLSSLCRYINFSVQSSIRHNKSEEVTDDASDTQLYLFLSQIDVNHSEINNRAKKFAPFARSRIDEKSLLPLLPRRFIIEDVFERLANMFFVCCWIPKLCTVYWFPSQPNDALNAFPFAQINNQFMFMIYVFGRKKAKSRRNSFRIM